MDYLSDAIEQFKEWLRRLIEALLEPDMEAEPELIPIPVNDPQHR
jgi:hypothetical protein